MRENELPAWYDRFVELLMEIVEAGDKHKE